MTSNQFSMYPGISTMSSSDLPTDSVDWEKGATAIAGILTAVGSMCGFTKWYLDWKAKQKKKSISAGITALHNVYQIIEGIRDIGVDRIILFSGHNCGGIPKPTVPFWVSALHWSVVEGDEKYMSNYQRLHVDAQYIKMLMDIENNGKMHFSKDTMQDGLLKRCYELEGVEESVVYFISFQDNMMFFMTISRVSGMAFTDKQVTQFDFAVERIRQQLGAL